MKLFDYFGGALALLPHTGSAQDYAEPEGFDVHEALHSRGIHVRQLANTSSTKLAVSYEHCTAAVRISKWLKFQMVIYFVVLGT